MRQRLLIMILIIGLGWIWQPVTSVQAAQRCFGETGYCIDGRIREFWEQNGGLPVFGFPIASQEQVTIEGRVITVQRFERNRIELHPNNQRPYDVQLGRLGVDRLQQQGRDWFGFAKSGDTGGCRVFGETGHAVCGKILQAWRSNGLQLDSNLAISEAESLALFGLPISGVQTETLSDGKQYQVQWFERARFELHPENAAPYDVLLGLLGNETQSASAQPAPAPTQTKSSGPGSLFVPLKTRMFAQYMFDDWGFNVSDWEVTWQVTPEFFAGLNDGTATLYDDPDRRKNLVQTVVASAALSGKRSRSSWNVIYGMYEFVDANSAYNAYLDLDLDDYVNSSSGSTYTTFRGCREQWSIGSSKENYLISRNDFVLQCENKVLWMIVIGDGPIDEWRKLYLETESFFANSFRW
ncbi:MAG: hypothetical protein RI985_17 [Chloroflexota bacterium]|jgi:hypothetical protein